MKKFKKKIATKFSVYLAIGTFIGMCVLWLVIREAATRIVNSDINSQMADAVTTRTDIIDNYIDSAEEYLNAFALSSEVKNLLKNPNKGNIKKALPSEGKVIVEGANMITKATKANPAYGIQGGLIKKEAPLDSSNVMVICPSCSKPTRIAHKVVEGKKVRVCKKCGEQLDV